MKLRVAKKVFYSEPTRTTDGYVFPHRWRTRIQATERMVRWWKGERP